MKICPLCGYENDDTANTCERCNTAFTLKTNTNPLQDTTSKDELSKLYIMNTIHPALNTMLHDLVIYDQMIDASDHVDESIFDYLRYVKAKVIYGIYTFFVSLSQKLTLAFIEPFICAWYLFLYALQVFAFTFIVALLVNFAAKIDITQTFWFSTYCKIAFVCIIIALIHNRLEAHEFFTRETFFQKRRRKKKEKEQKVLKKAEQKKKETFYLTKAEELKKESINRIPGFNEKYWNYNDVANMLTAFTSYEAKSWPEAYRYARKNR